MQNPLTEQRRTYEDRSALGSGSRQVSRGGSEWVIRRRRTAIISQRSEPGIPKKAKRYQNAFRDLFLIIRIISPITTYQNTMKLTITLATLIGSAAAFAPSKMASSSTSLNVVSF
jgi:hypothetical protein